MNSSKLTNIIASLIFISTILVGVIVPTVYADPRPVYYTVILSPDSFHQGYAGSQTTITFSFWIPIPFLYSNYVAGASYTETMVMTSQAGFAVGTAIGAAFEGYSGSLLGVGGNGAFYSRSYDGWTCDHTIVVTSYHSSYSFQQTSEWVEANKTIHVEGYYWKHGWGCFDQQIPFNVTVSSSAMLYK